LWATELESLTYPRRLLHKGVVKSFCEYTGCLRLTSGEQLANSKTKENLKLCTACISYERRHGILIPRVERKRVIVSNLIWF
jgi:hypothetical protein